MRRGTGREEGSRTYSTGTDDIDQLGKVDEAHGKHSEPGLCVQRGHGLGLILNGLLARLIVRRGLLGHGLFASARMDLLRKRSGVGGSHDSRENDARGVVPGLSGSEGEVGDQEVLGGEGERVGRGSAAVHEDGLSRATMKQLPTSKKRDRESERAMEGESKLETEGLRR